MHFSFYDNNIISAQYRITYSIWDDEDARSTDRQYVQIKGTDGVTQEHMCENDFDVINEDVTCVFESKDDIGDYRCVHLRIGGRDGIDITQVRCYGLVIILFMILRLFLNAA